MKYVGEWLTLDQAARVLGVPRDELRALHIVGDIECAQVRPGVWRVRTTSVDRLRASAEWKEHAAARLFSHRPETGPGRQATDPAPAAKFSAGRS